MRRSLAVVVAALAWVACRVPEKPLEPGDEVPAFTASTLDGDEFDVADLVGAPYMLNIWATWCAPCRHEMPELQELHDKYAGEGFRVVGVSVDDHGARETIREFLGEVGVDFPIYHDPSGDIVQRYGFFGVPGTFLVDAEGRFVRRWMGEFMPMAEDVQESVRGVLAAASDQP